MTLRCAVLVGCFAVLSCTNSWGQGPTWPGSFVRGWSALQPEGTWVVPTPTHTLNAGERLHPAAPPGVALSLQAMLRVPETGVYRFGLKSSEGSATLVVTDHQSTPWGQVAALRGSTLEWTERIEGKAGDVLLLELSMDGTSDTGSRLQVWWECEWTSTGGFPPELLPASATVIPSEQMQMAAESRAAEHGLTLLEKAGCLHCHSGLADAALSAERTAPSLDDLGARMGAGWLRRWLADPHAVRAGALMPQLPALRDKGTREALVHFLLSKGTAQAGAVATEPETLQRGRSLYHAVGCVACHGALASLSEIYEDPSLDPEAPELDVLRPFGEMTKKWNVAALARFLEEPSTSHSSGRMPNMRLTANEADLIANYLGAEFGVADVFHSSPILVKRGAAAFVDSACTQCHANDSLNVAAPALVKLDGVLSAATTGCLDAESDDTPTYAFEPDEYEQVAAALNSVSSWQAGTSTPLFDQRQRFELLGCIACHDSDLQDGQGHGALMAQAHDLYFQPKDERVDLGDEGRMPPDLEQAGAKYTTAWLREVLLQKAVARPYMNVRMPVFRADLVGSFVEGFAAADGVEPESDAIVPGANDELALHGRDLVARGKFGCIACHNFADRTPVGSPGVQLDQITHRLRWEWARAYLANPQRYRPGGRMPNFGTGKSSSVMDVLGGDLEQQIHAIWTYLSLGDSMPAPVGLGDADGLQLSPNARPIVLRGFMPDAGSRAIAVGLPVGVHFAYDAEVGRLAYAWRGDFLDASGSWAGRGGSPYNGLGDRLWTSPNGRAVAGSIFEFQGYSIDADGRPTFHSKVDDVELDEAFGAQVSPDLKLTRTFTLRCSNPGREVWLQTGGGVRLALTVGCNAEPETREGVQGFLVKFGGSSSQCSIAFEVRP